MRLFAFIVALLLLAGGLDPTRGHLILLVVITGLAWVRIRPWRLFRLRPEIDLRLAAFVLAVLLLAGTIDPTRGWLIALSVVTGLSIFMPRMFMLDPFGFDRRHRLHRRAWRWDWDWDWDDVDDDGLMDVRAQRRERRWARRADRFGDGWR
ncbi:MAG TPA: hypothetical protein VEZ14_11320 [Dehalococcoidia bacterium]|nr:hypothetical protein [Dehalococcoidia bacterium]